MNRDNRCLNRTIIQQSTKNNMGKTRLEAFSDGVLAIIITIMVLELKIPEGTSLQALKPVLAVFLTYALSFIYIGIYWNNHHHLMHLVKHISAGIMWANLNLLFWLSLIPFATGWMDENYFEPLPVALYAALLAICGIAYTILQATIDNCHKSEGALKEIMQAQRKKGIISFVIYIAAIPLAYINTIISGCLFIAVAIMWIIPDRKIERITTTESK
ncbi:TMEM175 family protein [Parafilimonas sp.]|uniref:TMEM175 family protein n=1 Tax=Parafilimonas sp. TaxID=1969739 RepID=UPI0039E2215F